MQTLSIPTGPQNPAAYTAAEVLRALRGVDGTRRLSFRYELLDAANVKIGDLTGVLDCTVSQSWLADIKRTAKFTLRADGAIDFLSNRIKPWVRLHMPRKTITLPFTIDPVIWTNRFNVPHGTPVTVANSGEGGDNLSAVTGTATYDGTWSADGGRSLLLGAADGSEDGAVSFDITARTVWALRTYLYVPSATRLQIAPDGIAPGSAANVVLDDIAGTYLLGSTNITAIKGSVLDRPVRLEIENDGTTATYRLYWSNPAGSVADHTVTEPSIAWDPVQTFTVSGGGAAPITLPAPAIKRPAIDSVTVGVAGAVTRLTPEADAYVEWPQGVFLLATPTRASDAANVVTRSVDGYDQLQVYSDDMVADRYTAAQGAAYTTVVSTLLGSVEKRITPSSRTLPAAKEWEPGTSKLAIINELLSALNYESLSFDENGVAIVKPYVSPQDRPIEYTYADDAVSVMRPEVEQQLDLFSIPNRWVLVVSDPDRAALTAIYTNNDPASPTSTVRRQRVITDFRQEQDAADQATLDALAARYAFEASQVYENITFSTAIMPFHSGNDVYRLVYGPLAVNAIYAEYSWEMPMQAGAEMKHQARRVVTISDTTGGA
ncbi:hypothetical protein [Actinomadura nitritigenes]|uniref:hypothetical protein n=1 Tax=Actinomadura nitritigenes TaxID=134602 RepID=UPI003D8AB70D